MARRVDLGGRWELRLDASIGDEEEIGPIPAAVPGFVFGALEQSGHLEALTAPHQLRGREWVFRRKWIYSREIETPDEPREGRSERYFLHIRAAGEGPVRLDGQLVGYVRGPWIEERMDITAQMANGGKHTLAIHLDKPPAEQGAVPLTGILSAHLVCCAFGRIMSVSSKGQEGKILVNASVEGFTAGRVIFHYRVLLGEELVVSHDVTEQLLAAGQSFCHEIPVENPLPWRVLASGERPVYSVRLMLERGGTRCDSISFSAAFADFSLRPPQGAAGALPYAVYEGETPVFYWAAQLDPPFSLDSIRSIASAGARAIRFGGTLPPGDDAYALCDDLGLLIWQELPFDQDSPVDAALAAQIAGDAAGRLALHPAAAIVSFGRGLTWPDGTPAGLLHPQIANMRAAALSAAPELAVLPTSPSGPIGIPTGFDAGRGLRHDTRGPQGYHAIELYEAVGCDDSLLSSDIAMPAPQYWPHTDWQALERQAVSPLCALAGDFASQDRARYLQLGRYLQGQALQACLLSARARSPLCAGIITNAAMPYPSVFSPSLFDFGGRERPALGAIRRALSSVAAYARLEKAAFYPGESIGGTLSILTEPGDTNLYRLECRLTDTRANTLLELSFQGRGEGPCGGLAYAIESGALECIVLWLEVFLGDTRIFREAIPLSIPREGEPLLRPLFRLPRAKPALSVQEGVLTLANDGPEALLGLTVYDGDAIAYSGALLPWEAQALPIDSELLGRLRIEALNV